MLTKISQRVFLFETKNSFLIKQPIINNFKMKISGEFIMSSRISTLCRYAGNKKPGTSSSCCWSCCTGGRCIYNEMCLKLKNRKNENTLLK